MPKVCIACGITPAEPQRPANEPEDCPNCDGEGTVVQKGDEEDGSIEESGEEPEEAA